MRRTRKRPTASGPEPGSMETASQALGILGEKLASSFLRMKGYQIILKNYQTVLGEVDLIARHGGVLTFIEVKTRRSTEMGDPLESITFHKKRQIVKVAQYYLKRYGIYDFPCRFDVVSILLLPEKMPQIELIQDAFSQEG